MDISVNNQLIAPTLVTYNSAMGYGQFNSGNIDLHTYKLVLEKSEVIEALTSKYPAALEEIRCDDELTSDESSFKSMGYAPLVDAFNYPDHFADAISTYFDHDLFESFLPMTQELIYVINSTDKVSVLETRVIIEGRCFAYRQQA